MKVILLHGLGQSVNDWQDIVRKSNLSDIVLFPLFQDILPTTEISLSTLQQTVDEFLETIHEPFVLGGLSLGAVLTLQYSIKANPMLKGIIVSAGQFEAPNKVLIAFQTVVFNLMPASLLKKSGIDLTKKQLSQLMADILNLQLRDSLATMNRPALVICGSKDRSNLKATKQLGELLPNATVTIIPNGKHELNESSPFELAEAISHFIHHV
jgi:pimeloyl-ACP methyl ester carboxylesterase